jgi:hypothetical protein
MEVTSIRHFLIETLMQIFIHSGQFPGVAQSRDEL